MVDLYLSSALRCGKTHYSQIYIKNAKQLETGLTFMASSQEAKKYGATND